MLIHYLSTAGVIAISWIMSCKISMVRKQLRETRKLQLRRFKIRAKVINSLKWSPLVSCIYSFFHLFVVLCFAFLVYFTSKKLLLMLSRFCLCTLQEFRDNWPHIKNSRRLIIHIPSLGRLFSTLVICNVSLRYKRFILDWGLFTVNFKLSYNNRTFLLTLNNSIKISLWDVPNIGHLMTDRNKSQNPHHLIDHYRVVQKNVRPREEGDFK